MPLIFKPLGSPAGMYFLLKDTAKLYVLLSGPGLNPKLYLAQFDKDKKELFRDANNKVEVFIVPEDWENKTGENREIVLKQ